MNANKELWNYSNPY